MPVGKSAHRRPGVTFYRYVAHELVGPTVFAVAVLTAVVLTKDLLGYSDLIINRGFGAGAVARIAFYQVVPLATMTFPLAVFLGALVALGRLGADREILALEASGVAATRLVGPLLVFASATTLACAGLSLGAAPWANRALDGALEALSRKNPGAQVRAGNVQRFGDWKLEAREVSSRGDRMQGVLLWASSVGETIFSQRGALGATEDGKLWVTLEHGRVLLSPRPGTRQLEFEALHTTLPESDEPLARRDAERLRGATLAALRERAAAEAREPRAYPRAALEYHRRFALPVTTLCLGLLAVPLFLTRRQFSRSAGGLLGLVGIIGYFGLLELAAFLIESGRLGAAAGAWFPNLVLGALGAGLLVSIAGRGVFGRDFDRQRGGPRRQRTRPSWLGSGPRRYALDRYIARQFAALALLSFAVLLGAYLLIDLLERSQWFAKHQASGMVVLQFYAVRIPLLASRIVPMALLTATALTASLLAVQGELMGMRACGIPAPRALLSVLLICALVAPGFFLLNNVVIPRTSALQDEVKETKIKPRAYRGLREAAVWYRVGDHVYQAERLDPEVGDAREIAIYELGADGLPVGRADARSARHIGRGVWRLVDPVRIELANGGFRTVPAAHFAELGEDIPAQVDTMHLSVWQLEREIAEVEASGYDATAYRVDWWVRMASPWACLVLPAVVLFFAVGGPPFPAPAVTVLLSGALGVAYVLLSGASASLGYGGAIPPILAGWSPTVGFAGLAAYLGLRLLGRAQPLAPRRR